MIRTILLTGFILIFSCTTYAQPADNLKDSTLKSETNKWDINLDAVSRYIWRGQPLGGNYPAIQPSVEYAASDKLQFSLWATSNLKKDFYYSDGISSSKGYQEIDLGISYQLNKFMALQVCDYYWPSVTKVEDVDNSFFNYGSDGVKTIDAVLLFDFADIWLPAEATISTLVAGNDFRYDNMGENPKQNFTTYVEAAYTFENVLKNYRLKPVVGVVLNNQAGYYEAANEDKISFVNLSLKASRDIVINKRITLPLVLNYIHNGSAKNTSFSGRDYLVAGLSFNYK
jgi:hypothetical protein